MLAGRAIVGDARESLPVKEMPSAKIHPCWHKRSIIWHKALPDQKSKKIEWRGAKFKYH